MLVFAAHLFPNQSLIEYFAVRFLDQQEEQITIFSSTKITMLL